jgi:hypothetical protein
MKRYKRLAVLVQLITQLHLREQLMSLNVIQQISVLLGKITARGMLFALIFLMITMV